MNDTHINKNSKYQGNLKCSGNTLISGEITGKLNVKNIVKVEKSGIVNGDIHSKTIFIDGVVKGNVYANKAVILKDNCNLTGNIETPSIIVEERSTHNGKLNLV